MQNKKNIPKKSELNHSSYGCHNTYDNQYPEITGASLKDETSFLFSLKKKGGER
jgi:hypothetical protein